MQQFCRQNLGPVTSCWCCTSREGEDVGDPLVESRVGPVPEERRLVLVVHVVLDVSHLVLGGEEVVLCQGGTHLDTVITRE